MSSSSFQRATGSWLRSRSAQERAAHDALNLFTADGFGYFLEQSTRPQTIGYSLLDSPIGLAAWMFDHDTDSYYKISRALLDGVPTGALTRESIVDKVTLYWLTGTSSARWRWEFGRFLTAARAAGQTPPPVSVPIGFTTFPGEIWAAPRSWAEAVRLTAAAASRPGRSRSSSPLRCGQCSGRCGDPEAGSACDVGSPDAARTRDGAERPRLY